VSDCTGCQNLSNLSNQGTREMCRIVQDVRTCLICQTKGPGKCVGLYRMSEPVCQTKGPGKCVGLYRMSESVQSVKPRDQRNMSDRTGCQNCLICQTKGPGKCVGLYRMSEYSRFILVNIKILGP
jgi:hypothetical protein